MKKYTPSKKILERYADVMVNYVLNNGKGIKKGEVVLLEGSEHSKPLYAAVYKEILTKGGHVIQSFSLSDPEYSPTKIFFENATPTQAKFFPEKYYQGLINSIDHLIAIRSQADPQLLKKFYMDFM